MWCYETELVVLLFHTVYMYKINVLYDKILLTRLTKLIMNNFLSPATITMLEREAWNRGGGEGRGEKKIGRVAEKKKKPTRFLRGSNPRPSACKADVITTTPRNQYGRIRRISALYSDAVHAYRSVSEIWKWRHNKLLESSRVSFLGLFVVLG